MQTNEASLRESRVENQGNRKRRGRRSSRKTEEQVSPSKTEDRSWVEWTTEREDAKSVPGSKVILEEPLKPRWILQPNESRSFKIRFQPEETGLYEETYALTILGGNNVTYELKVTGIADIPRLDTNPPTIFTRVINRY